MNAARAALRHVHHGSSVYRHRWPGIGTRNGLWRQRSYATHIPPIQGLSGISPTEVEGARQYCLNLLRKHDAPSHTLLPFIPRPSTDAYLALRALNVDVARVADATSNSTIARMRMQFWRDGITRSLAFAPPKEPVAVLLTHAAQTLREVSEGKGRLSKNWLFRIIKAREDRLENPPFANLANLETYAENTYSTLLYLTLSSVPLASITADHIASHIGKAQGIVAVLRGLPFLAFPAPPPTHHISNAGPTGFPGAIGGVAGARQGSVALPLDIMAECGVREEDIYRSGGEAKGLTDAVFKVATRANDHLITVREMISNLQKGQDVGHEFEHGGDEEHARGNASSVGIGEIAGISKQTEDVRAGFGVFMPAVATQMWLERLEACSFDVFDPRLRKGEWKLPWRAYWAFKRQKL